MKEIKISDVISQMSLEEKIKLCSGAGFWTTEKMEQYQIPELFMCDGPHGLRKQEGAGDHLGLNASVKTTCFPTASLAASTFNQELIGEMGKAIGREAVHLGVNIVLGPGVNMKRNPLCGRNFEYYSEDPYLAGKLGSAWIQGVESQGVGTSLKHFALNNQETKRMTTDVLADERAKREYYLAPFEIAVKEGKPTTVMCAYNKVDGTYCSDNAWLLDQVLRKEWGFEGAVITDWGAMNDRNAAFRAGVELEMPGSMGFFDKKAAQAVRQGELDEKYIDRSVERLLKVIDKTTKERGTDPEVDLFEQDHELAQRIAGEGAVLLKNEDNILPLKELNHLTVIGSLAETPRYQGTGSSQVIPTRLVSTLEGLGQYNDQIDFAKGYWVEDKMDATLIEEAVKLAEKAEQVLLCIGLTEIYESEGFDRPHMKLPRNQLALLDAVAKVNQRIIVLLFGGSAVETDWDGQVKAILHMQLSGQAGGQAAADLLVGKINPSGRLAETYPFKYEDVINSSYYLETPKQGVYRESLYCGYRYFTSTGKRVRYPFGYGLSYTAFDCSDLEIKQEGYHVSVTLKVSNTGKTDGAEVVQIYVRPQTKGVFRPKRELKAFTKVYLKAGEERCVTLQLEERSFAVYNTSEKRWMVEAGDYDIEVGKNCEEIVLTKRITLKGETPVKSSCSEWYYTLDGIPDQDDFATLYGPYSLRDLPVKAVIQWKIRSWR